MDISAIQAAGRSKKSNFGAKTLEGDLFFAYVTPNYLKSARCMQELRQALNAERLVVLPFADSIETLQAIPTEITDQVACRIFEPESYWPSVLELAGKAWESLQTARRLVASEDHILTGPAIFDSEGYTRRDLLNRPKKELILAAANLRSWMSDSDSRQQLVDLVKVRRIRVTLILATYETLRPISAEGALHLRQSVEDIKPMLDLLTEEERALMRVYFHVGATTLSAVFIDPEEPDGILFFSPRWAIQFQPQDRLTCVIDKTINSAALYKAIYNSVFLMTQRDAKSIADMLPGKSIFISYRRADSADITGRLTDRLIQKFGPEAVFKDVDSILSGTDFRSQIEDAVKKCDVFIAVIGREWTGARDGVAATRLDNANDFVRLEIEAALRNEIPIIPVLVQGASVPAEEALPESMRSLCHRHAVFVHTDPDFHRDTDRLIRDIEKHLRDPV